MYGIRIYYFIPRLHTASQKMLAKRRKGKGFRFRSEGQERELERRECGRKRKMTQCLLEGGKCMVKVWLVAFLLCKRMLDN